jgi:hypothetical protein
MSEPVASTVSASTMAKMRAAFDGACRDAVPKVVIAAVIAALGILVFGFVISPAPADMVAGVERGVSLSTKFVGLTVSVAGLLKGTAALFAPNRVTFLEVGESGFAALTGAALILVGNVVQP